MGDYIQTIRTRKKSTKYNVPLYLAFVDYQKSFDSVEIWATMLETMDRTRIESKYINLITNIYEGAILKIKIDKDLTKKILFKKMIQYHQSFSL